MASAAKRLRVGAVNRVYLPSLDGLRGVAALAVVGSHFENLSGFQLHLQDAGAAVDFFFILSGFVIGQAYEPRLLGGLSWRAYMGLRLGRLYPAILGGLIVGLAVATIAGDPVGPAAMVQFLLAPVLFGPAMHGGELFPLNGPQWSLFWELIANAAHALVVRWLTVPLLVAIVVVSGAAVVWASLTFGSLDAGWGRANLWGGPPRVAFGFFTGVLLFRLHAAGWRTPRLPYPLVALALGMCMFRWFPGAGGLAIRDIVKVIVVLPALVAVAVNSRVSPRLTPVAIWLGALSYPLYAIHVPLLRGGEQVINQLFDTPPAWAWWLCLAATLVLATAFERFYDAPIRAWLRGRRRAPKA